MHFHRSSALLLSLFAMLPPLAASPVVELDPVNVTAPAPAGPALTVPDLAAARAELALTPGGADLVDTERTLRGRASTLADTFAFTPGVFAQPRFGSDEARLSIRGSGLQRTFHGRGIRLLQDGVPLNLADGGFDMQSLEPVAASYVTVLRGANALARGASTLGGAIDYVSRTGRSDPGALARLELGSWDYLRATVAGGLAAGPTDAFASFTHSEQDGFREHARQENDRLFTNLGRRLAERVETRVFLTAVRTDSELPGNLTKAQLEADPRQANPANITNDQKRDFDLLRAATKTTATFGDASLDLLAAWTYKDLDHPIFQVIDQLSNDALLGLALTDRSDLFGRRHRLRAGLLYHRGETDAAQYNNVNGARGVLRQRDAQVAANLEAFAESQLELGRGFTGVLGFSAAENRRENTRLLTANPAGAPVPHPAGTSYDRRFENIAPKLGLRWDNSARDVQLYANLSGSHEPPSFGDGGLSGATVVANRAQEAITYELGTRGRRGPLRWDASVYHARIEDELLAIQLPGPVTGTLNADHTIHQGVELGLEADLLGTPWKIAEGALPPARRLVARAAWTYGDFRFDGPVPGVPGSRDNRIAGVAPHLLRGELLLETRGGWYLGPNFEWVPQKSYIDHANTLAADTYALLGFKLGRRVPRGFSWFVEARNLADETHAATHGVILDAGGADQPQFLPGDGRSVYLGLEYKF